ncbi:axonemal dynein heavy chain (macronuclear) [Tetrahymena thermophila SB210]|uniref:Axonemal dynein heavy chain n=3 Tax=Tetrahymena thermophila TaxID=5911 RepID=Q248H8_TETTS|nr:axonemal dynein heavy chain [Tetrahymena thermophila SB210]EAS04067.1 axonemal dynein heavy chain [Tetrahymena thermophila SB210]|eukprot:XP_001024312.1 axonemal dynein heavy chain [Tetrahymena thermophila SB210]
MSYRHQKNRSLGPIVKINIPKFAFEEAQQEEKNVESFLDQQQGNQMPQQEYQNDPYNPQVIEDGEYNDTSMNNTYNTNNRTQNRMGNHQTNLPQIQGNRRASSTQRPSSQQNYKKQSNNQSFRYDSNGGQNQNNNLSLTMNNKSLNQNESQQMQQPQRSHSKSLIDYQSSQSKILNGSVLSQNSPGKQQQQDMNNSHLDWISTLARKEQAKIIRMPARNPNRIQVTMQQQNKINNHILDVSGIMNDNSFLNKSMGGAGNSIKIKQSSQIFNSKKDESMSNKNEHKKILKNSQLMDKNSQLGYSQVNQDNRNTNQHILQQNNEAHQFEQSFNDKKSLNQSTLIERSKMQAQETKQFKDNQKQQGSWNVAQPREPVYNYNPLLVDQGSNNNKNNLNKSILLTGKQSDQIQNYNLIESSKQGGAHRLAGQKVSGNQKQYDRWDSERSPEEWLKLYKNQPVPHGLVTTNVNNKQKLLQFQLLEYDQQEEKYQVKILESGEKIWVNRLYLIFNDENQNKSFEKKKTLQADTSAIHSNQNEPEEDEDKINNQFPDQGLKTKQSLKKYDCWDQDKTPQEWLKFYKNNTGPHGMCPTYINQKYQRTPIQILDYDEESEKYLVRVLATGIKKWVIRLSILFNHEDPQKYYERLELAKSRMQTAEDETRFLNFIDKMPLDQKTKLLPQWRREIVNLTFRRNKDIPEQKIIDVQLNKMMKELISELEIDYIRQIKKGILLREMQYNSNTFQWQEARIQNRYVAPIIPFIGTILKINFTVGITVKKVKDGKSYTKSKHVQLQYPQIQAQFAQQHYSKSPQVTKTLNIIAQKTDICQQKRLFQIFQTNLGKKELPVALNEFSDIQKDFHNKKFKDIKMLWQELLVSNIQEHMEGYKFYVTSEKEYIGKEIQLIVNKMDYMFNSYIRQLIVQQNIREYVNFFKRFTQPKSTNTLDHEQNWLINNFPLLIVNLRVNTNYKRRKDKKKKDEKKKDYNIADEIEEQKDEVIFLEPSKDEIKQNLLQPFDWLIESVHKFKCLETDLVSLLKLDKQAPYPISYYIQRDDPLIIEAEKIINDCFNEGYEEIQKIINDFNTFTFLYEKSSDRIVSHLFPDKKATLVDPKEGKVQGKHEGPKIHIMDLERIEILNKLREFKEAKENIQRLCIDEKDCRLFRIRTKQAKDDLIQRADENIQKILAKLRQVVEFNVQVITDEQKELSEIIVSIPQNEEDLVNLKNRLAENEVDIAKMKAQLDCLQEFVAILESYTIKVDKPGEENEAYKQYFKNFYDYFDLFIFSDTIKQCVVEGQRNAQIKEEEFTQILEREKDNFEKELTGISDHLKMVKTFSDYSKLKDNNSQTEGLKDRINAAKEKIKSFNDREVKLKLAVSEYSNLNQVETEFQPYYLLWFYSWEFDHKYEEWTHGPITKQNFPSMEKKVNQTFYKECIKLNKIFLDLEDDNAANVTLELKKHIESFRENMWMIELLSTEAMSNLKKAIVHWNEIFKAANIKDLVPNEEMSLKLLLDQGLNNYREVIEEVSKRAEKQYTIEKKLKEMEDKVKVIRVELMKYKKTGTYVLKGVDEIQQLLDDQLNVLLMMKASPYIKPVLKQAQHIEMKMILIQDTLEQWLKCQRGWMYLEPIFASEDIKKKMEKEKLKFDGVDNFWRITMDQFNKESNLWESIDNDRLKSELITYNKSLDQIQKSLSDYLESKRRDFPRFFFLSDEELLEILADTKDPQKVQKHINKCFEAVNLLDFFTQNEVGALISSEKEKVKLLKPIDVTEGEKKGNVEKWLLEIEKSMIRTLHQITKDCMVDVQTARTKWIQKWPGQIVLAVNMMRWTRGAEIAIINGKGGGEDLEINEYNQGLSINFNNLKEYSEFLDRQLKDVVDLVRTDLTPLARLTLGALVVLDVHAKDVILDLEKTGCTSIHDFNWTCQLRYYWEEVRKEQILNVKMINAVLKYGFEYLGNSPRLVITPLTDRCYRTLMGAFHLSYGGAPEGPAGTGKTETVKDLAKALAVQIVVFNCSDGLNYLSMRKFFKGIASSGAWCCFDEFNRIDLEVLSVIAQQVLTIQTAIKEKRRDFIFDGESLSLIPSCAINITMNPGYAGRSELPDNLKALFRPCAMMVPDYALIAEIYLYSVGFQDARNLARKIVASLRLSSEQLSSQDHYDFGMRALKAILTAAGNLKRTMKEIEDIVCLRALMDVNIPKFTYNDVPLFLSITNDLFPGVKLPEIDYGKLENALKMACFSSKLQPEKNFINKCIQLFDTINVRHGLMVVGDAFSGKSSITSCLQKAISSLKGIESYVNVASYKLNPKSITSDQLYGKLDPDTKSWSDGVIAIIMRLCAQDSDLAERKWIIFDGPVDAVWIENMNTVLDDNKKLCLTSGEIIKMSNWMTMMFEVQDLAQASPATVSRCGMVFLETNQLGWTPLIKSFIQKLPKSLEKFAEAFQATLLWLIDPILAWALRYGQFLVHKSYMNIVNTLIQLMNTWVKEFEDEEKKVPKDMDEHFNNIALFSTIWAIGGALEENTRKQLHEVISHLILGAPDLINNYKLQLDIKHPYEPRQLSIKLPDKVTVFDICFDSKKNQWVNWTQTVDKYIVPKEGEFHDIFVPTNDSIRNNFFLHKCIQSNNHLLICGPTGTGKTVNIINELQQHYFNSEYTNLCTSFSGQTQANQVQRLIESKVCTRRRKGVYGPEEGKRHIVIFIDDLNMPAKEKYGAQPPIELLRQWMDEGGWYDLETKEWKQLQDIIFIAAMLPPVGGRNSVTMRYLRHYNLLYVQPFDEDSLLRIFNNIIEWYFNTQKGNLSKSITSMGEVVVKSTIEVYNAIRTSKELLPTPAKSHYIYNLRDISKVFQGISKASYKSFQADQDFIKLWAHECMRVFQDRLINNQDQAVFEGILKQIISKNFKRDWDQLIEVQPLLWASFVPTLYPEGDTSKRQLTDVYCELTNREDVKKICYAMLEEYNNLYSGNRMNLVLFMTAIQHIIKIVRVITTPFGHCLLIGVGGSGRKSLATLASFIAYTNEPIQVDQKNWIEDLQRVMKSAGVDKKDTIFLFSDTQIAKESMVEDICNILNNGEVPNLFPNEERAKIIEEVGQDCPGGTPNEKYKYFVKVCRQNLHLVLAFSPVGEAFRRRLRTFPSLVNCTTIDWFLPWPEDALRSTASNHFVNIMKLKDQEQVKGLVEIAVDMQVRITNLSERYIQELRRYYYVTPTSYLELLNSFEKLVQDRTKKIFDIISRYETGVSKILSTEQQVQVMQKELEELQPQLVIKTEQNQKMLIHLQKKQKEADAKREVCENEEKDCNVQRDKANALKEDCQQELDKVLPILGKAAQALDNITKDDMTTLKSFTKPPEAAAIVMEGMCYAFDEDQNVKLVPVAPGSMEKKKDFWDYAKKKLLTDKLINRVKDFKEDKIKSIPKEKVEKLKVFVQNPLFEKDKVFNASKAAGNLSLWIRAVIQTYDALLVVEPKRRMLEDAENQLKQAESILNEKKKNLQEVIDLLQSLQNDYERAQKEKEELEQKVNKCKVQLERADALISGLGGEKNSWKQKAELNRLESTSVIGDCMISAGIIAYLGAFPISYREEVIQAWKNLLIEYKILFSQDFNIQNILCNPITIGQWTNRYKLPNDSFSIDNAIILKNASRWPLMIDPQTQANTWIRNLEEGLIILRPTQNMNDILLKLENSITLGQKILLENLGEQIDSVFEPVLQKKLVKQGSSYRIKFGDKFIDYNDQFRFYMTTKLPRPHYPPEVCVKVTLLNFQVTAEGLEDQMLNIIVKQEEPQKDQQREKNVVEFFANKEKQVQTENKILQMLFESKGNLLDDENLIYQLQQSKNDNKEIQEKLKKQEQDRLVFNQIRDFYREVAKRVANLYFVILDLALIEPTYQWSLEFYITLFLKAITQAIPGRENRCKNIIDSFQFLLYESICRSLLEKDKLIFSFLLCVKIMEVENMITKEQTRFMMVGGTWTESPKQIPENAKSWLSNKTWCTICELSQSIEQYKGFDEEFAQHVDKWYELYQSENPHEQHFPGKIIQNLNEFQKLVLVRILFPDKFQFGVQKLIINEMGEKFIQPPPFNLEQTYVDADCYTPLIFILSSGADPRLEIITLSEKLGFKATFNQISLGQGQGEFAEKAISEAIEKGYWVLLQNCHLAPSFMPELERILENVPPTIHPDFRIWLTSMPSDVFPPTILMKGIKMTFEPPRGLKNNLLRSFQQQDIKKFEECEKPQQWKKLFFGLAFFHALILERRKYGPLGWNIPYEFTAADFTISYSQLKMFLNEQEEIPWDALNYMVAEANYGGRVTDPKDRRLIKILLKNFYTEDILQDDYKFSESGIYYAPADGDLNSYKEYIQELPRNETTEVYGLHQNAQISSAIIETNQICNTVLGLLPRSLGGGGKSADQLIKEKIHALQDKLPKLFDVEDAAQKHPVKYEQSMNTVLQQELIRFNKLLSTVRTSLANLDKAIDGFLVMSADLEEVYNCVFDNKVPDIWHKVSYPSLKPLGSWINDFVDRLKEMQRWIDKGSPASFWVSGFFFTQSFLTGTLQNYARKKKIPIDTLTFDFVVIPENSTDFDLTKQPEDGCYIYGLFFDGAAWDHKQNYLNESQPKVLYSKVPYIWLVPTDEKRDYDNDSTVYEMPVYKTSRRAGTLSTTGHSTNFVLSMYIPIAPYHRPEHWVKRGVAALTQLND